MKMRGNMRNFWMSVVVVGLATALVSCSTPQKRPFVLLMADQTNVVVDIIHFGKGDQIGNVTAPEEGYALTSNAIHKLQQAGWMP